MEYKTGDKVVFCEEEYEVIGTDTDSELDIKIEDDKGYTLWVNHSAVRRAE